MRYKFGLFVLLFVPYISVSQGVPSISNYTSDNYQNSPQNWAITQDSTGNLYFGNSGGLIQFDGYRWQDIHIKNNNIVSALYTSSDSRILIGGLGEFGYLDADSLNQMNYKSYSSELDSKGDFTYVWDITEYNGQKYFRTQEAIFVSSNEGFYTLESNYSIGNLEKASDQLFVWLLGKGLHYVKNNGFEFIEKSDVFSEDLIYDILPFGDEFLLCFRKAGLVVFDGNSFQSLETPASSYIKKNSIYKAKVINNSQIALATLTGGIVIMNTDGSLYTILTEEDGLPTNVIYDLFVDNEKNLWATSDNGLVKILINNPVTKLDERSGFRGIPTFITSHDSTTYFGSTEGLFYSNSPRKVNKISSVDNRVYDGIKKENKIIFTTPNGLFKVEDDEVEKMSSTNFKVLLNQPSDTDIFYGATSDAIYEIKIYGDEVEENKFISSLGNVYDFYLNKKELWFVTSGKGISRHNLDGSQIKKYEVQLAENEEYKRLDYIGDELRLGTDAGLFVHNSRLDSFVVDTTFRNAELAHKQVNRFRQCGKNEIWFRNNRKIKRAVYESVRWNVAEDPYRFIDEGKTITTIHCGESDDVWFGGTAGIYHLSDPEWKYDYEFNTNITGLLVNNDSLIYGGYGESDKPIQLSYEDNQLRFTYAAASYVAPEQNMYKVRLRGYDNSWSNWTSETGKDYTFIPEGTYTFEVQGRNVYHKTGSIDSFTFTVLPPWHRTWLAYSLYLLLIGGAVYGIHRLRINRILREQRIRNRIASDLHDEVSATLSSITYFAQAIRQTQNGGKSERFVGLISESASDAKEKITDIIWSIDPENDDWVNLLAKCRRFASDLLESKGMDYDLDIDTDINRPLDIELRQHLWLIYKEMVVNAARHSGARKVDISFGMKGNTLRLIIQDNGKGMPEESERKSGHGIKNIKKRSGKIGAKLQLETDSDMGTRWIMTLNMR